MVRCERSAYRKIRRLRLSARADRQRRSLGDTGTTREWPKGADETRPEGLIEDRMSKPAKRETVILSPGWESLFLVCKDCRRRKDGPKHLKAKALAREIKHQTKDSAPGARVVLTTCLKLCPKKATSVAFVTGLKKPRIAAVKSSVQLQDALALFLEH
jgi:hypothetical protein